MAVAAILAAVPSVIAAGRSIFGGGDPGASGLCPNQRSVARVQAVLTRMTSAERAEWLRLHAASNPKDPYTGDASHVAFQLSGGSDCKVSSSTGKAWVAFHDAMDAKYASGLHELAAQPSEAAVVAAQRADQGVGGQLRSIVDSVLETGKDIARSTVTGAIAGARSATQGAEVGAAAGASATQNALPLLGIAAVGAIAVVLFLAFRRRR